MAELEDSLEAFGYILDDFVDIFMERLHPDTADKLLAEIQSNPYGWFDAWAEQLSMRANTTIYAVSAKKLLGDYLKRRVIQVYATRLEAGAAQLPAGD